jgi:hypothetical protein
MMSRVTVQDDVSHDCAGLATGHVTVEVMKQLSLHVDLILSDFPRGIKHYKLIQRGLNGLDETRYI